MQQRNFLLIGTLLALPAFVVGCARHLPPAERVQTTNVIALRTAFGGGATETAATATAVAEPTGWATIKGTFKLEGTPPARTPLAITKDHEICAPGGKPVLTEELVVDSATQGIKDVVIYLASPGKFPVGDAKWEHPDYAATATATFDYDQKNCVFLTHTFAMRSKQKAKVINSDPVGHNTNIQGTGKAAQINATIPSGSSTTYEPGGESPEPFSVSCAIHPWMSARMIVRDSPYFAVTKPDGSFEIANIPAGVPLEFRVWQEKGKFLQDVKVDGKVEKWSKGRLKLTLQPGEQKEMEVVVDAATFK
ncbi:MAG TPA: hypothetical protein VGI40_06640 [Pirellulaceae bacterium]|jgi:hypothetical protein